MCAPFFTWRRAISTASSHFSSAIRFLNSARADDVGALAHDQRAVALFRLHQIDARVVSAMAMAASLRAVSCLRTICAMAAMCLSVVPQQPPTIFSQPCLANRSSCAASDVRRLQILALFVGQPGVGIAGNRASTPFRDRLRMWSVMNSGPVAQLSPIDSRSACAIEAQKGFGVLPGQHGAHGFDGARDHDRECVRPHFARQPLNAQQRRP